MTKKKHSLVHETTKNTTAPKVPKKMGRPPKLKNQFSSDIARVVKADEVLLRKVEILELISSGTCINITAAAEKLGISPGAVYMWSIRDPDFGELLKMAQETFTDKLEQELATHSNFIPRMMVLKGRRPIYRDNWKAAPDSQQLVNLLSELKKLGQVPKETKANDIIEPSAAVLLPEET
jgi:hypothetical protein